MVAPARAAALIALAATLLTGCNGQDETTSTGAVPALEDAATTPVVQGATNTATALLRDLRATREDGFDRVVFGFDDALPGYDVRYVERPVVADGSGDEVAVAGEAVLLVRLENALDADLSQEDAPRTYLGPTRFAPGLPRVAEVVRTGGFEGVLTWALGLEGRARFRVSALHDPARLVIDVAHP